MIEICRKRNALLYAFLILIIFFTMEVNAEINISSNFLVSNLTASQVDCRKCHTDTPHIIHAQKPVTCENCHGDKLSVSIPLCTKCHDGPIHKVHAGKLELGCQYCHRDIAPIHTNLLADAVCSHCHKDLIQVHGENQSCVKCHRSPPDIVKPLKAEGLVLICQDCHSATSVATIHGDVNNKQSCYNCHKGTSNLNGSDIPHTIHQNKVICNNCHEQNGKVIIPQCANCHKIDDLHSFNKIGKLTVQSGLKCSICHADITGNTTVTFNPTPNEAGTQGQPIESPQEEKKTPGFDFIPGIGILILYFIARKIIK